MTDDRNSAARYLTDEPELISGARVAVLLKCSVKTVKAMLARGELSGARFGRNWLITKDSIAEAIMGRLTSSRNESSSRDVASKSPTSSEARAAAARLTLRTAEKLKHSQGQRSKEP